MLTASSIKVFLDGSPRSFRCAGVANEKSGTLNRKWYVTRTTENITSTAVIACVPQIGKTSTITVVIQRNRGTSIVDDSNQISRPTASAFAKREAAVNTPIHTRERQGIVAFKRGATPKATFISARTAERRENEYALLRCVDFRILRNEFLPPAYEMARQRSLPRRDLE